MLELFYHPFSSYSWKALIALFENETPFTHRTLSSESPQNDAELRALWPLGLFPVLKADGRTIVEATCIIEHLEVHHPGRNRLIPNDPDQAIDVRMRDRIFDNYVMTPMQKIVADRMRLEGKHDPHGVEAAAARIDKIYRWLDDEMATRQWAAGDAFTLADCAAAPSLFYADWVRPIKGCPNLSAYRARLLARKTVARAIDGGRPYRHFFPGGAPDRD